MLKQMYMYVREEARLAISVRGPRLMMSCMVARWLLKVSPSDSSLRACQAASGQMTASPWDAAMAYSNMDLCSALVVYAASKEVSEGDLRQAGQADSRLHC